MEHFTEDHQRKHYRKKEYTIAELIEQERKYALSLPETVFPVFKEKLIIANKYSEVKIDKVAVHIPERYHHHQVRLVTYGNGYKVVSMQGELLSEGFQ